VPMSAANRGVERQIAPAVRQSCHFSPRLNLAQATASDSGVTQVSSSAVSAVAAIEMCEASWMVIAGLP
jgi:hypothetical protein